MHLVVGLGNPGTEYQSNRHNIGFMVVDDLLGRARGPTPRGKFGAELAEITLGGQRVLLCKPMEFMNVSGQSVARVAGFWKVPVADTIVVHDDLDIPFGRMKLGAGGGHGGHNGLRSIAADLGDPGFARVRFGIGRPAAGRDSADYVLADFSRAEAAELPDLRMLAADAVEAIVTRGLTAAMNRFNGKAGQTGDRA
jgi:peptidyl-tRNA hydrolase, PTH1 family